MDKLLVGGVSLQVVKWGAASRDGKGLVYLYQRGRRLHLRSGVQGAPPKLVQLARARARASSSSDGDALPGAIAVKFVLPRECCFGQSFSVVGDDPLLGGWNPDSAVPMKWSEGHIWTCEVDLLAGKRYEYKFLLKGTGSRLKWQLGPNRWFETGNSSLTIVGDWDGEASPLPVKTAAERVLLGTQEDTATVDSVADSIAEETSILDAVEDLVKPAEEQVSIEEPETVVSDPIDQSEGPAAALPDDPPEATDSPDDPAKNADADHTVDDSTPPSTEDHLEVVETTIRGENSQVLGNGEEESTVSGEEAPEKCVGVSKQEESDTCLLEDSRGYITFRF